MPTLVLVRHAKSDWGDPSLADHDRPLNDRGRSNAPMMAERFAATGLSVDRILSSTALRARTTAAAFGDALGLEVQLDSALYASSASTLVQTAMALGAEHNAQAVMLVAHHPGITVLAEALSGGVIEHMPTCAVATFSWGDADWHELASRQPETWSLSTPR